MAKSVIILFKTKNKRTTLVCSTKLAAPELSQEKVSKHSLEKNGRII